MHLVHLLLSAGPAPQLGTLSSWVKRISKDGVATLPCWGSLPGLCHPQGEYFFP